MARDMSEGFYKRRRGILEHLESGRINLIDLAVHDYLNLKSNLVIGSKSSIPPGVCITSAAAIHAVSPGQPSERAIQRSLEHLERIGWIKRWIVRGRRGNYPVLVCRGSVHDLSGKEYRINGEETTDWRHPKWTPVGELSASTGIGDEFVAGNREVRNEKGEKPTKAAAKTTPLPSLGKDQRQLQNLGNGKHNAAHTETQIGAEVLLPGTARVTTTCECGIAKELHRPNFVGRKNSAGKVYDGHAFVSVSAMHECTVQ